MNSILVSVVPLAMFGSSRMSIGSPFWSRNCILAHCGHRSNKCFLRRWQCQVNLLHIFEFNLKYLSNTTFRHPFDSLVTGMSWPDDPVIVIQNVNFSTQKGNEKQPQQEALHDELKLRNPGVHISNLGARDQRSICRTGCLGAGQCFATQLRKINMLS